jgi:hypothetical protein
MKVNNSGGVHEFLSLSQGKREVMEIEGKRDAGTTGRRGPGVCEEILAE